MSTASIEHRDKSIKHVGDSLFAGVAFMLCFNVVQRLVGLLRGLGFCKFLSEDQLGQWSLANSFLAFAIPLAILGLPGSFGKFVEHYRRRNQLGDYFWRVIALSTLGTFAVLAWIVVFPNHFSRCVFDGLNNYSTTLWLACAFLSLLVFSVAYELAGSLRHVRVLSLMHFIQSVGFAVIGLPLIIRTGSWTSLIPAYAIACILACIPGIWCIWKHNREEFRRSNTLVASSMWKQVIPFAASIWFMNALSNLIEVLDRYMLLHLCPFGTEIASSWVGEYHCARILPTLMVSLGLVLSGLMLPFLSRDWEDENLSQIRDRMRQMIQMVTIGYLGVGLGALLVSPWLFKYGLDGRYADAQEIMPIAMVHAVWVGMFLIGDNYLVCSNRMKALNVILIVGILFNFCLNWLLIPSFGLVGAVTATTLAGLVVLLLLFWQMARGGCPIGWGTWALCVAPLSFVLGPTAVAVVLATIVFVAGRTNWLLSAEDRSQIDAALLPRLERFGIRSETIWP